MPPLLSADVDVVDPVIVQPGLVDAAVPTPGWGKAELDEIRSVEVHIRVITDLGRRRVPKLRGPPA